MFFIYGTDAPLYHYPITTTAMVSINVFVHLLVSSSGYDVTPWILAFGDGFHPVQWVTHNFLHIGWLHLIGNMLFLFPFGLVVEGKLGWLRMLILYFAIAAGQGFTQQLIMLPHDPVDDARELVEMFDHPDQPLSDERKSELTEKYRQDMLQDGFGSLGASAVVFGLLAVCAIWAPQNEFDVFFRWSPLRAAADGGLREWSVLTVCGIFVVKEFGMFLILGMSISSEALHLNGFVVGGFIGMGMLWLGYVDCEGFDLLSMYTGTEFKGKAIRDEERRERMATIEAAKPTGPPQAVVPTMAHELVRDTADPVLQSTTKTNPDTSRPDISHLGTKSAARKTTRSQPSVSPEPPVVDDTSLPEFDDGTRQHDPLAIATKRIETWVANRQFTEAARGLFQARKEYPGFTITPASMGRLAEGLIAAGHVTPAIRVLLVGSQAFPVYEPRWRLRIASLELKVNQDPIAAIKQLQLIDKEMLDSALREQFVKIGKIAKDMAQQ